MRRTFTGRPIAAAPAAIVPAAWSLSAVPEKRTRERLSFIGGSPGGRRRPAGCWGGAGPGGGVFGGGGGAGGVDPGGRGGDAAEGRQAADDDLAHEAAGGQDLRVG